MLLRRRLLRLLLLRQTLLRDRGLWRVLSSLRLMLWRLLGVLWHLHRLALRLLMGGSWLLNILGMGHWIGRELVRHRLPCRRLLSVLMILRRCPLSLVMLRRHLGLLV